MSRELQVSVVIPVFNEERTICQVIENVRHALTQLSGVEGAFEIFVVDDGSTDSTRRLLEGAYAHAPDIHLLFQPKNRGKGAAVARGVAESRGAIVVIQDADLEYDPRDLRFLFAPIFENRADVVFGSRFRGRSARVLYFRHYLANRALTFVSNVFTNLNLTDVEAGYKAFRGDLIRGLTLESARFGFEPEVAAKVARIPGVRVYEVGISYFGRTYEEGKKVTWRDGVAALWWIAKFNVVDDLGRALSERVERKRGR